MDATLTIRSADLDAEGLQRLAEELCRNLSREAGVGASVAESPGGGGAKGDVLTVGTIILTLLGGRGVARALVEVLSAYVSRGRHLEIEIKGKGGEAVRIEGDNLDPAQLEHAVKLARKVLGGAG